MPFVRACAVCARICRFFYPLPRLLLCSRAYTRTHTILAALPLCSARARFSACRMPFQRSRGYPRPAHIIADPLSRSSFFKIPARSRRRTVSRSHEIINVFLDLDPSRRRRRRRVPSFPTVLDHVDVDN